MSSSHFEQWKVRHNDLRKRSNVKVIEERENNVRITKIEINQDERQHILEYYHNMGTPGTHKTTALMQRDYRYNANEQGY